MAIGTYKDVYTVEEYEHRVNNIGSAITELNNGQFFFEAKAKVEQQIKQLQDKEKQIFKLLKVKDLADLNLRLEEYKKAVLNLSGADLNQIFLEALRWENDKEFAAFERDVTDCIDKIILEQGETNIEDLGVEKAWKAVLTFLNDGLKSNSYHFSSQSGMTTTRFNIAQFTKEQKNRWKILLAEKGYSGWEKNEKGTIKYNIEVDVNKDSIQNTFSWRELTQGLTPREADNLPPEIVEDINQKIRQLILSKTSDSILINQIITHILSKNKYAFFVGKNINDITGILGEIQGLYYLSKFFGDDFPEALQWRGGIHEETGGKKPHQDILLKKFGIQVKNSSKEDFFESDINFANASIDTILNKIGISSDAKELFLTFYATLGFNVEYHRDRRKRPGAQYLEGIRMTDKGAARFVQLHTQLQQYEDDIQKLLSLFAATLMYMDFYEHQKNLDANVLYLLGGTAFQTASNILSTILSELEFQERRFQIKASFKRDKNIIAALNAGARGKNYSNFVLNDIILTSSFRF